MKSQIQKIIDKGIKNRMIDEDTYDGGYIVDYKILVLIYQQGHRDGANLEIERLRDNKRKGNRGRDY